jgi:cold shock CspA family protein
MLETGIVAKLVLTKGFGFITPTDPALNNGADMFFHASATVPRENFDTMEIGCGVTFEVDAVSYDRPRAVNVQVSASKN